MNCRCYFPLFQTPHEISVQLDCVLSAAQNCLKHTDEYYACNISHVIDNDTVNRTQFNSRRQNYIEYREVHVNQRAAIRHKYIQIAHGI